MSMTTGSKGVRSELNVTPMIDIMLVLLIIFMVMTPVMMKQHRVEVPKRVDSEVAPAVSNDQTVLTFTRDGQVFINQTVVERAELSKRLRERFEGRRDKTVFLNIDPDANYGEATRVIDLARNAGLEKLAIVTQKDGEKFQVPQGTGSPAYAGGAPSAPIADKGGAEHGRE